MRFSVAALVSVVVAAIALSPAAVAQWSLPEENCDISKIATSVVQKLNDACCTAVTCQGAPPTVCSPACGLVMAAVKQGAYCRGWRSQFYVLLWCTFHSHEKSLSKYTGLRSNERLRRRRPDECAQSFAALSDSAGGR